jgi:predicted RNase H-like nuclease
MPRIREVDTLLQRSARARAVLREVHPEVCFWSLAGRRAMSHNKKTQSGFEERLDVLLRHRPDAADIVQQAMAQFPRKLVARDDIVDALVVAVTASRKHNWLTLPPAPETDARGLPMEMVYAV